MLNKYKCVVKHGEKSSYYYIFASSIYEAEDVVKIKCRRTGGRFLSAVICYPEVYCPPIRRK